MPPKRNGIKLKIIQEKEPSRHIPLITIQPSISSIHRVGLGLRGQNPTRPHQGGSPLSANRPSAQMGNQVEERQPSPF